MNLNQSRLQPSNAAAMADAGSDEPPPPPTPLSDTPRHPAGL